MRVTRRRRLNVVNTSSQQAPHHYWPQAYHVCKKLNRAGLSAFPIRSLSIVSIGAEGRSHAASPILIEPLDRLRIVSILEASGYEAGDACELVASRKDLADLHFPDQSTKLEADPAEKVMTELDLPDRIVWATSTQTILCLLHQSGGQHELTLQRELLHLVWEQPADLDLIRHWAGVAGLRKVQTLLAPLTRSGAEGIELRRRNEFRSLLPR